MSIFEHVYPYTNFHELDLSWVILKMKELNIKCSDLEEYFRTTTDSMQSQIDYLMNWVNNYSDSWAKSVIQKYLATMIFVEISDAGYIVYYIPDSWDEIVFNTTGLDINVPDVDFGHLVLSY